MRRLAARRTGGAPDNKPGVGGRPLVLLASPHTPVATTTAWEITRRLTRALQ
jgi:hypothetical protein